MKSIRRMMLSLAMPWLPLAAHVPVQVPAAQPRAESRAVRSAPSVPSLSAGAVVSVIPRTAAVPFAPGEEAKYKLKVGIFNAGEARLAVAAVENVRGHPAYRLEMDMKGGVMGARVDDQFRSWMDTRTLASRRFMRDIHEVRYNPPPRTFEIYPEERRWERTDNDERGVTLSDLPLDELSFIYFLRTIPDLQVGREYRWDNYFKEDGNPAGVKVVRRERKTVPAGTFNTLVLQPIVRTTGLFSEGGRAEIYVTDDAHRHVVYLSTRIPKLGVGHITMHLTELRQGQPQG